MKLETDVGDGVVEDEQEDEDAQLWTIAGEDEVGEAEQGDEDAELWNIPGEHKAQGTATF